MWLVTIFDEKETLENAKVWLFKWKDGLLEESMVSGFVTEWETKETKRFYSPII